MTDPSRIGLLTEAEAAARLCLSPRLLRSLRKQGHIRYVALSARRIAYRTEDCDAYVESRVRRDETCASPMPSRPGRPRTRRAGGVIVSFSELQARRG